jgi:hypothetical protein
LTIYCLITSTDELFKSAAYLTEAFTGVQLSTLASTPNLSFPADVIPSGTTTIPSTSSSVINDPTHCAPTARSSSVLTHIVYPENGDIPPSPFPPSTGPLENDTLYSPPKDVISSQPFATEPSVPLPPCLSLVEASTQTEQERLLSGDAAKLEKLPAFNLGLRTNAPFFDWLENGGTDPLGGTGEGAFVRALTKTGGVRRGDVQHAVPGNGPDRVSRKSFRLQRFSRAMVATTEWEAPKAILSGKFLIHISCVIDTLVDLPIRI